MDMDQAIYPGSTLAAARRAAGLTQAELARLGGTSQATISAYESGRKEPSLGTFRRLLGLTGMRLSVEPATTRLREPSRGDLMRAGQTLEMVLELAEALPGPPKRDLSFPHLAAAA